MSCLLLRIEDCNLIVKDKSGTETSYTEVVALTEDYAILNPGTVKILKSEWVRNFYDKLSLFMQECGSGCCGDNEEPEPEIEANGLTLVCDPNNLSNSFFINSVYEEGLGWLYTRSDNGLAVAAGTDFITCPNIKTIEQCYNLEDRTFTVIVCLASGIVVNEIIWENGVGEIPALPTGAEVCSSDKRIITGEEIITFTDTIAVGLNPPTTSTNHVELQAKGCCVKWRFGDPTVDGYCNNDGVFIELESRDEIDAFMLISNDAGCSGKLIVTYYCQTNRNE